MHILVVNNISNTDVQHFADEIANVFYWSISIVFCFIFQWSFFSREFRVSLGITFASNKRQATGILPDT